MVVVETAAKPLRFTTAHFFDRSTSKSAPRPSVLALLTLKCASRHNGVHFFDIATSTACIFPTCQLPKVVRTVCVLFMLTWKCASRHNGVRFFDISISKSGPVLGCFVHFDLEMCFAPQRRAIFHVSSGQMVPHPPLWRAYVSTLRSHKSLEKHSVSRLSYLFAHLDLLSSDCFFFDPLSSFLLFSYSSHLCFSSIHIVGSLTSKLPSISSINTKHYMI